MPKANKTEEYYHLEVADVIEKFSSSFQGLSFFDAKQRLAKNGHNELPEIKRDSYLAIFIRQFKSPLIYILLISSVIVFFLEERIDAMIIFSVILFNAVVGSLQEGRAQNTFLALKKFIKSKATVLRENEEIIISDRDIVSGDIIILREGEKVPADARVISSNLLKVDESALTGESIPKFKTVDGIAGDDVAVMNQNNMLFKGTIVVSGNGRAVVIATGINTFLGGIAKKALDIDSEFPLKNEIDRLSRLVIVFVFLISISLILIGQIYGHAMRDVFKTIIAISVSVIPEGLPIVMTLVLATGVWRMGKKNVLVKKLQAVEVLGEVKILAVDKTGTITKNELVVEEVYSAGSFFRITGDGYVPKGAMELDGKLIDPLNHPELLLAGKIASLNSGANLIFEKKKNKWRITGDPTDGSLLVFSRKIGYHRDDLLSEVQFLDDVPFDYELRFHASLYKQSESNFLIATGSPETILNLSENEQCRKGIKRITKKRNQEIQEIMQDMSRKGFRVIGFASCETNDDNLNKQKIPPLVFGGFFGIRDTLREGVIEAVKKVSASGIKVVMLTGDHEITARAIAKEVGICQSENEVMKGGEIELLSDTDLANRIKAVSVFSRITPNQKLKIIKAYKDNGLVIAMTGDGVNDALSLTAADIGIGMGKTGTEVANEASDILLLDDNFGNIVHGVDEGKNIYSVIKKVILYLFSTNIGEVFVIFGALLLGFPLPILAAQILWLNLVTDGFLDIALAMEPKEKEQQIQFKDKLIDKRMLQRIFFMSITMAVGTLYLFSRYYQLDITKAWTVSLTTLAVFQWFNAWNCRSEKSIFKIKLFSNKFLLLATLSVIVLQLGAIYNSFFQKILRTVPLEMEDWFLILAVASSIIVVEEARKLYTKKRS